MVPTSLGGGFDLFLLGLSILPIFPPTSLVEVFLCRCPVLLESRLDRTIFSSLFFAKRFSPSPLAHVRANRYSLLFCLSHSNRLTCRFPTMCLTIDNNSRSVDCIFVRRLESNLLPSYEVKTRASVLRTDKESWTRRKDRISIITHTTTTLETSPLASKYLYGIDCFHRGR